MPTKPRRRLGRQDWIEAAVQMGIEQGFDNLAVEPLAARLGATKGSFYWHFTDRAALLTAVLNWWEQEATARVIGRVDQVDSTRALAALMEETLDGDPTHDEVEWRLLAAASNPQVGPVLARAYRARVDYVERLLRASGVDPDTAHRRARVTYAGYLGILAYRHATDEAIDIAAIRRELLTMALAD